MQLTFRPSVQNRNTGIWTTLLFGSATAFCFAFSFFDDERPVAWLVMGAFWGCPLLFAIYTLIAYYREWLTLDGRRVCQQTVFVQRELTLDDSVRIKWRTWAQGGSIVIQSPQARIPIHLQNFEKEKGIALIKQLRDSLPLESQLGWEMFCLRHALPLVEPSDETITTLLTRRHIDRLFAWMLLPNFAVTALLIWLEGWKWWPSLFVLVPFWLVMRLAISRQGQSASPTSSFSGFRWWLGTFVGLLVGMMLYGWMKPLGVTMWVIAALCFVQFFRCSNAEDRRRRAVAEEEAKTADVRWRAAMVERTGI